MGVFFLFFNFIFFFYNKTKKKTQIYIQHNKTINFPVQTYNLWMGIFFLEHKLIGNHNSLSNILPILIKIICDIVQPTEKEEKENILRKQQSKNLLYFLFLRVIKTMGFQVFFFFFLLFGVRPDELLFL